jgi:hypothetical protein|tara:strand:- start:783 stop:920 length:138 start_codon:yes stop_codon:yes gene_type:complete
MTKPIAKYIDAVEIYFESGSARIRFKDGMSFESLADEKLEKQQKK